MVSTEARMEDSGVLNSWVMLLMKSFWISESRIYCCSNTDSFIISNSDKFTGKNWEQMLIDAEKVYSLNGEETEVLPNKSYNYEKIEQRKEVISNAGKLLPLNAL
jgi:hypothetical protein